MTLSLDVVFTRKIWKKLRQNQVPIVDDLTYKGIEHFVENINRSLQTKSYMPSIGHGYLGISKGNGVTRFLPILTKEDMAIYYYICFLLSDFILEKRERIFGGWHIIPNNQKVKKQPHAPEVHQGKDFTPDPRFDDFNEELEENAKSFIHNYYTDPFSSSLWFKEWRKYTDLISALCGRNDIGNFVAQTDIANFYDSIEIPRLTRNLRRDLSAREDYVEILELFLQYWNRRVNGYNASSKGIPQEIISDASRILSHYYLQDFDASFSAYCNSEGLINVRWADDLLIFGKSPKQLENSIHKASRLLLSQGLNLNASKTLIFSRSEFAKYRCLDILNSINEKNLTSLRKNLRSAIKYSQNNQSRIDTVFRSLIGFIKNNNHAPLLFEKNFIFETARENRDILISINDTQMFNLISISEDPKNFLRFLVRRITSVPYAAPRATFLQMLRKYHTKLRQLRVRPETS